MAIAYERELRAVLAGDPGGVRAVTRSCTDLERARAMRVVDRSFLVMRAAGSGTAGAGDLLACRGDLALLIEVKTSATRRLYLSGRTLKQYEALRLEGIRCGLMPLYAMRLKGVRGDSWRLLRVEAGEVSGPLRSLVLLVPALPMTARGRPCLDWDLGLPLHRFLGVVCAPPTPDSGLGTLVARSTPAETPGIEIDAEEHAEAAATPAGLAPEDLPQVDIPGSTAPRWVRGFRRLG